MYTTLQCAHCIWRVLVKLLLIDWTVCCRPMMIIRESAIIYTHIRDVSSTTTQHVMYEKTIIILRKTIKHTRSVRTTVTGYGDCNNAWMFDKSTRFENYENEQFTSTGRVLVPTAFFEHGLNVSDFHYKLPVSQPTERLKGKLYLQNLIYTVFRLELLD